MKDLVADFSKTIKILTMKIYTYKLCSTCKKAIQYLNEKNIDFTIYPIRETPPSVTELKRMLSAYNQNIKRLLNTSSKDYRDIGLKDRLDSMDDEAVFELLQTNGNLVKRPFLISDDIQLVGFKPDEWNSVFT